MSSDKCILLCFWEWDQEREHLPPVPADVTLFLPWGNHRLPVEVTPFSAPGNHGLPSWAYVKIFPRVFLNIPTMSPLASWLLQLQLVFWDSSTLWGDIPLLNVLFIHPPVNRHLCCFQGGSLEVRGLFVHTFSHGHMFSVPLHKHLRMEFLDEMVGAYLTYKKLRTQSTQVVLVQFHTPVCSARVILYLLSKCVHFSLSKWPILI